MSSFTKEKNQGFSPEGACRQIINSGCWVAKAYVDPMAGGSSWGSSGWASPGGAVTGTAIPSKPPASATRKASFYQSQHKFAQITAPSGSCHRGVLGQSPRRAFAVMDVPVPAPSPAARGCSPVPLGSPAPPGARAGAGPGPWGFSHPTLDFSWI